jgi:hypothetical protein
VSSAQPSSTDSMRQIPVRSWRQLDHDEFRAAVATSRLCRTEDWPVGVDELSALYNDELQRILDVLVPLHASSSKRRPTAIGRQRDKSSAIDPMPTSVLKSIADLVAPFIAELFSRSLEQGYYPNEFKRAFVTPVIKQTGLDASVASSYRPISNLSVLSKLFDRMVARQLLSYLNDNNLLHHSLHSGFRSGHSTETAVLHVLSDILAAVDRGEFAALVLLDLSAAFDTVDHHILLERLQRSFGIWALRTVGLLHT